METKSLVDGVDDELVLLAKRLCSAENVTDRPGCFSFECRTGKGARIRVTRSRFDPGYGGLARISAINRRGRVLGEIFVPTSQIVAEMKKSEQFAKVLRDMFDQGNRTV